MVAMCRLSAVWICVVVAVGVILFPKVSEWLSRLNRRVSGWLNEWVREWLSEGVGDS